MSVLQLKITNVFSVVDTPSECDLDLLNSLSPESQAENSNDLVKEETQDSDLKELILSDPSTEYMNAELYFEQPKQEDEAEFSISDNFVISSDDKQLKVVNIESLSPECSQTLENGEDVPQNGFNYRCSSDNASVSHFEPVNVLELSKQLVVDVDVDRGWTVTLSDATLVDDNTDDEIIFYDEPPQKQQHQKQQQQHKQQHQQQEQQQQQQQHLQQQLQQFQNIENFCQSNMPLLNNHHIPGIHHHNQALNHPYVIIPISDNAHFDNPGDAHFGSPDNMTNEVVDLDGIPQQPNAHGNYVCRQCDCFFKSKSNLRIHVKRKHAPPRIFQCSECPFTSSCNILLSRHRLLHSEKFPFGCYHCDARFTLETDLIQHMSSTHTTGRAYKCNLCPYDTTRKGDLDRHQLVHCTYQPHSCSKCDAKFKHVSNMKKHVRQHHPGSQEYKCSSCAFSTFTESDLNQHLILHGKDRPYACDQCQASFKSKKTLNNHKKKVHFGKCTRCSSKACGALNAGRSDPRFHQVNSSCHKHGHS